MDTYSLIIIIGLVASVLLGFLLGFGRVIIFVYIVYCILQVRFNLFFIYGFIN